MAVLIFVTVEPDIEARVSVTVAKRLGKAFIISLVRFLGLSSPDPPPPAIVPSSS